MARTIEQENRKRTPAERKALKQELAAFLKEEKKRTTAKTPKGQKGRTAWHRKRTG